VHPLLFQIDCKALADAIPKSPLAIENARSKVVKASVPWGHLRKTRRKMDTVRTAAIERESSQLACRVTAAQSTAKTKHGNPVTRKPTAATPRKQPAKPVSADALCKENAMIEPAVSKPKISVAPKAAPVRNANRMTSLFFILLHNVCLSLFKWSYSTI
jgi:hypothetical protein